MSDSTHKDIKIDISFSVPVDTAQETIDQLIQLATVIKSTGTPLAIGQTKPNSLLPAAPSSQPVLYEDDPIAQGMIYAGQKAYDEKIENECIAAEEAEVQRLVEEESQQTRAKFYRNVVQAYRLYRRVRHEYENEQKACKFVGLRFGWAAAVTQSAIKIRRKTVKDYLRNRQNKLIVKLRKKNWKLKHIADRVGVGLPVVQKALKFAQVPKKRVLKA